jgi:hypothetical protein
MSTNYEKCENEVEKYPSDEYFVSDNHPSNDYKHVYYGL